MSGDRESYRTLLPFVMGVGPTPPVKGQEQGREREGVERILFDKMSSSSAQQRPVLIPDERLKRAACKRVRSMAENGWAGHVDPDGHGPDWYVKQEGYVLPPWYWVEKEGDKSNHIESMRNGGDRSHSDEVEAEVIWNAFMNHEAHRIHLLGEQTFAEQTHVGICVWFDESAPWVWYTSILTAPP